VPLRSFPTSKSDKKKLMPHSSFRMVSNALADFHCLHCSTSQQVYIAVCSTNILHIPENLIYYAEQLAIWTCWDVEQCNEPSPSAETSRNEKWDNSFGIVFRIRKRSWKHFYDDVREKIAKFVCPRKA